MTKELPEYYGVLYKFVPEYDKDVPDDFNAAILLLEPKFKGIVIRFGIIQFVEMDGVLTLKYTYDIVKGECPKQDKEEFENTLGNLAYDLILTRYEIDK